MFACKYLKESRGTQSLENGLQVKKRKRTKKKKRKRKKRRKRKEKKRKKKKRKKKKRKKKGRRGIRKWHVKS